MENPNQAMADMFAVADGRAKAEDFTGQRAADLRAMQDIEQRSGGMLKMLDQVDADRDARVAELDGMTKELVADINKNTYLAQAFGTVATLGYTVDTAIQGGVASGNYGAIALDKLYSGTQTVTGKAMEVGDYIANQFGDSTPGAGAGQGTGGPGGGGSGTGASVPGGAGGTSSSAPSVTTLAAAPKELHGAAENLNAATGYAQTGDRNLLVPPEGAPVKGLDVVGSGVAGMENAGKVYGAVQDREAALKRGDDDAARMATYKAIDYSVKTTGNVVELGQKYQSWRNGQAVDENNKLTKIMGEAGRISSAPIMVEAYGEMWRAKTDTERAKAFETYAESGLTATFGEKGGKVGKGIGGATVSYVEGRDAYRAGDKYQATVSGMEGAGKLISGGAALMKPGLAKIRVEAVGKGLETGAKALKTGREVVQLTDYRNQLTSTAQFADVRRRYENERKLTENLRRAYLANKRIQVRTP